MKKEKYNKKIKHGTTTIRNIFTIARHSEILLLCIEIQPSHDKNCK
jgi:hypothetical protein